MCDLPALSDGLGPSVERWRLGPDVDRSRDKDRIFILPPNL